MERNKNKAKDDVCEKNQIKIQKLLANLGMGSRRQMEAFILAGKISVNGKIAHIGDRMSYNDQVSIDGRTIQLMKTKHQKSRVLLYHKPEGVICTRHDPEGRPTIFEHLPSIRNSRWISVGRLDFNTSGLLLITNNGDLANQLMHPRYQLEREYAVRIRGKITYETLTRLEKGVPLEDGIARFKRIVDAGGNGSNHWYHVIVEEGRNRLVRRLCESQNLNVSRLIRIRYGSLLLPSYIRRGHYDELSEEDIISLERNLASIQTKTEVA